MPASKIHCDFCEIVGPNWKEIDDARTNLIIQTIDNMELMGDEPDRAGFVGTARWESIVGGFFAIQYVAELLHYDNRKRLRKGKDEPFERLFYLLFAKSGKLILQNRNFPGRVLNMEVATRRFTDALNEALRRSGIPDLATLYPSSAEIDEETFRTEFTESERVYRLQVDSPEPTKIAHDFVYYNPQFDRNAIIRESHQHDYPNFKRVDLEARADRNLKGTHIASDLVTAGTPILMKYEKRGEAKTLRRIQPRKLEIYVDVDMDSLTAEVLQYLVRYLRLEIGLPVDIPTSSSGARQGSLFEVLHGDDNEKDEQDR